MIASGNQSGRVIFAARPFNGVKIFSATMMNDRAQLGDRVTHWLNNSPNIIVTEVAVTQSSDEQFHCITITVCYWED